MGGDSYRQINWDKLYQTNYLNTTIADQTGVENGSTYIIEKRHSNQASWTLSSNLNTRLSEQLTLQAGYDANYTRSSYYKTIDDLLGGRYWLDVDNYSERDFPGDHNTPQGKTTAIFRSQATCSRRSGATETLSAKTTA